jgi:TolA-binding protein
LSEETEYLLILEQILANFLLHPHGHLPIVGDMKRYFTLSVLFLSLCTGLFAAEDPVALAEKQDAEERYKRMSATLQELQDSVHAQQQTITKLNEELRTVRDELGRVSNANKEAATQESLKRLGDAIEEVDRKRLADSKNVTARFNETIKEMQKIIAANKPLPPIHVVPQPKDPSTTTQGNGSNGGGTTKVNPPATPENGFEYVVKPNDSLLGLVSRLNKQGVKVTKKQLVEANPEVNWDKLKIGQKIFIPKTA